LERYLTSRAIPVELARRYLSQIHYRIGSDQYRALGFRNDSGGYEVRNPYFKGSIGKKDMTVLATPGREDFAVFEGSMDFLSSLVWHHQDNPKSNVLVLNSVSFVSRAIERLIAENTKSIHTYLDLDRAGRFAEAELRHGLRLLHPETVVTDQSSLYLGHKDMNEYVMERLLAAKKTGERERQHQERKHSQDEPAQ
jgi:Toprim-like